jgi:hypothetical protein
MNNDALGVTSEFLTPRLPTSLPEATPARPAKLRETFLSFLRVYQQRREFTIK